jgi:hypothetical protein
MHASILGSMATRIRYRAGIGIRYARVKEVEAAKYVPLRSDRRCDTRELIHMRRVQQ